MQIGMIGLGKMGANMAERLMRSGHNVVGFDLSPAAVAEVAAPVIGLSLMGRIELRDEVAFADRLPASMRKGFGGHPITTEEPKQ